MSAAHLLQGRGNGLAEHKLAAERNLIARRHGIFLHIIGNSVADGSLRGVIADISGFDGIHTRGGGRPGDGCRATFRGGQQSRDGAGGGVGDLEGHIAAAGGSVGCFNAGRQTDLAAQSAGTGISRRSQRRFGFGYAYGEGSDVGVDHGGVWRSGSLRDPAAVLGAVHALCNIVQGQCACVISGHIGAGGDRLPRAVAVFPGLPRIGDDAAGSGDGRCGEGGLADAAHVDRPVSGLLLDLRQCLTGVDGGHRHRLGISGAQTLIADGPDGEVVPGAGVQPLADETGLGAVHSAKQIILIILCFIRVIPEDLVFDRGVIARLPFQGHAVGVGGGGQVLGNAGGLVDAVDDIAHHGHLVAADQNVPGGELPLEAVIRVPGRDIGHGAGPTDPGCDDLCGFLAFGIAVACADHKTQGAGAAADLNVVGIALGKGLAVLHGDLLRDDGVALRGQDGRIKGNAHTAVAVDLPFGAGVGLGLAGHHIDDAAAVDDGVAQQLRGGVVVLHGYDGIAGRIGHADSGGGDRYAACVENIVVVQGDRRSDHDHLVGAAAGLIADGGGIGMLCRVGFGPLIVVGGLEFNRAELYAEHRDVLGEGHIGAHGVGHRVGEGVSCAGGGTETGDAHVLIVVQQVFKIGAGLQNGHDFRVGKDVFLAGVAHDHAVVVVGVGGGQHHPAKGVGIALRKFETQITAF